MPSRSIGSVLLFASLAALPSPAAIAQDGGDIEDFSLEELLRNPVTSATGGVEVESDVVPANVTTISRDDIIALGLQSVAEVLQSVAGLYVIDDHVLPAVAVRGISGGLRSGSRIVKVMINGTEVTFRPDLTAMLGREYLPIIAVERIEIARGPLSALYGANAFLATVNVVTRKASEARSEVALSTERHQGDRASGLGAGGSALFSTGEGPHALVLAARFDRLDRSGLVIPRTFPSQAAPDQQQVFDRPSTHDLSRPFSLFGQATSKGGWGELALQGGFQRLDAYGEFQPDSALTHRSRHGLQNAWSALTHTLAWTPRLTSTVTVGASRGSPTDEEALVLGGNRNSIYEPELSYRAFESKVTLLFRASEKLQALFALEGTHENHQGFTYRQTFVRPEPGHVVGDQIEARTPIVVSMSNFAPALQIVSEPVPQLYLFANGRLDLSDVFATQSSWRVGAAYRLSSELVAKVIAGRAFQSPSPVLLYGMPGFGVSGTIIGSKTLGQEPLEPQIIQSAELVLSALPSAHLAVIASGYWQVVDQKIEFLSNAVGYRARNRRREIDLGGELSVRASYRRFTSHLTATTHHLLSTDEPPSSIGQAPAHFPTYWGLADLRMAVPEARLNVSLAVRRVGPRGASQGNAFLNGEPYTLAAYTRGDVTVTSDELRLLGDKRPTRAALGVRNLLNERHAEPGFGGFDIPTAGRTVFLELRQAF